MRIETQDTGIRFRSGSSASISPVALTVGMSLLALLVIVARWHRPGYVVASVDLFPDYDPLNLLHKSFLAWSEGSALGAFGFPTYSTYYLFNWIVGLVSNASVAQVADFWLFMATAWLGTFVLCRNLGFGLTACFLAAWSYVLNPAAQFLPPFITGSAYAAALPWLFWMVYKGASDPVFRRRIGAVAVATCFLLISWIASTPQLFFELLLILAVWGVFVLLRYAKPGFVVWVLRTSLLCIAVSLWWIVPVLVTMLGSEVTHATNSQDVMWTFKNASLLNNLRFVTAWTWIVPYYIPYANGYDANVATYAAGFWGTCVVALSLLLKRSRYAALVRFAVAITVVCFFITKGMHPPLEELNALIYKIPGFFLFIEPGGFVMAACLMVSLAIGIVATELQERASGHWSRAKASAFVAVTVAAGLLSASPLLNGLIFSGLEWGGVRNYIAIPPYWFEAAGAIDRAPGPGSVLVLPANDTYQTLYTWKYQGVDAIAPELIARPVLMMGSSLNYFSDPRLDDIKNTIGGSLAFRSPGAASELRRLGIRFILCRKDVVFREAAEGNDCRSSYLAGESSRRTYGELVVYDLGDAAPEYALAGRNDVTVGSRNVAGFLHVVSVPPAAQSATLTNLQFYHPSWYAIQIWPRVSILAHSALGWQNAWRLRSGGEVIAFNAVNAVELLFLVLGALVTFAEIRRARTA